MKSIGDIIREKRLKKNMTQEELGNKVFVTKQAVSKWEMNKTLPDIEMIRKLCGILDINKDEILGGSIEGNKKSRRALKTVIIISTIIVLISLLFLFLDGFSYIERHSQSGVAYISAFEGGNAISTENYTVNGLNSKNLGYGYEIKTDYGEVRGNIYLYDNYNIDFGFINTNNWHNIQIRLDISRNGEEITVKQTVSYKTDDNFYNVFVTENTSDGEYLSVFRQGI